jgi:UDP-3-O-[3-hydroxymyristoyl] glucosamine N-acyltransferase
MIIENNKPIKIIGYPESSMTDGCLNWFSLETKNEIDIITPENFLNLDGKNNYQYFVGFSLDMNLRKHVCDEIDNLNLDCITYIHDSCVVFENIKIGKGVGIFPFSSILYHTNIQDHCLIETYCLISHHVKMGKNSIVHSGTLIAGKTTIGENCTFGFKSSVINKINITDNVYVGAFSNITKDITKSGRYVGTIARYVGE